MSLGWNISLLFLPKNRNISDIRGFFTSIYFTLETCFGYQNRSELTRTHSHNVGHYKALNKYLMIWWITAISWKYVHALKFLRQYLSWGRYLLTTEFMRDLSSEVRLENTGVQVWQFGHIKSQAIPQCVTKHVQEKVIISAAVRWKAWCPRLG